MNGAKTAAGYVKNAKNAGDETFSLGRRCLQRRRMRGKHEFLPLIRHGIRRATFPPRGEGYFTK